jgi:hypothetical protein
VTANPAVYGRPRTVVLVEGLSDQVTLEVLARRRGRDLADEGVAVIAMHGATNLGRYLERDGPGGFDAELAGLCDAAEEDYFRRALRRAGIDAGASRAAMEALGSAAPVHERPVRQQVPLRALAGRRRGSEPGTRAARRRSGPYPICNSGRSDHVEPDLEAKGIGNPGYVI